MMRPCKLPQPCSMRLPSEPHMQESIFTSWTPHAMQRQMNSWAESRFSRCVATICKCPLCQRVLMTSLGGWTRTHLRILYDEIHFAYELIVSSFSFPCQLVDGSRNQQIYIERDTSTHHMTTNIDIDLYIHIYIYTYIYREQIDIWGRRWYNFI